MEDFEDLNESTKATETKYGPWYSPISGLHDGHSRVHLFQGAVRWFSRLSFVRRWLVFTRFRSVCHLLGGEFQWQLCRDALRVEQGRILWDEHKIRAMSWTSIYVGHESRGTGQLLPRRRADHRLDREPWWFGALDDDGNFVVSPLQRMVKSLSQTCCLGCDSWPVLYCQMFMIQFCKSQESALPFRIFWWPSMKLGTLLSLTLKNDHSQCMSFQVLPVPDKRHILADLQRPTLHECELWWPYCRWCSSRKAGGQ